MNRFLLLAFTCIFLSPITAKAEDEFTELTPVNPYSYQQSSVSRWWKEGKRYLSFKGTTSMTPCFTDDFIPECVPRFYKRRIREGKVTINKSHQPVWKYQVDCVDQTFNREGDLANWKNVRLDPTAQTILNKFCSLNNWNKLPLDTTK
jgi:hypothetical protein|tara:strand:- start:213 stop:656 length:444 start_codon:yes stop_codon:yes gene_type:complete